MGLNLYKTLGYGSFDLPESAAGAAARLEDPYMAEGAIRWIEEHYMAHRGVGLGRYRLEDIEVEFLHEELRELHAGAERGEPLRYVQHDVNKLVLVPPSYVREWVRTATDMEVYEFEHDHQGAMDAFRHLEVSLTPWEGVQTPSGRMLTDRLGAKIRALQNSSVQGESDNQAQLETLLGECGYQDFDDYATSPRVEAVAPIVEALAVWSGLAAGPAAARALLRPALWSRIL